ncbi:putative DNA methylase [Micrococcales bacterium KH10]|nr:putative DNA methylase [Micrococcales bacterium KH10]
MAGTQPAGKKLIEVSLPLETINAESAREKSIRHGHPSTLHLWWARRPLAAARAVLFAQLVDDPSARPDEFPTEEDQARERERLHNIIRELVVWENASDTKLLARARAEILKSTGNNPPAILDPFAGGGTIPLEAQRLGLEAHASDLNPVAVLINKALIEIPPKFAGSAPVFPGVDDASLAGWSGAAGLAEDVRRYGEWMRERAEERIGHLYPKATLADGSEATVIAWIWARTVTCPNPACGIEMPLVRSWWLGKKKGKEAYVVPTVVSDESVPAGKRVAFEIGHDLVTAPTDETDGTVGRQGAVCVACGTSVELKYIRAEGRAGRMDQQLMAVVAEGKRQRTYLAPTMRHVDAADLARPADAPSGELPKNPRDFKTPNYGMTQWADLFTHRQLVALTTFSDLVGEARERVLADAIAAGMPEGEPLAAGGTGASAYADAVATYLGLIFSRSVDRSSSLASWDSSNPKIRNTFGRQALPMVWDFAEANLLSTSTGSYASQIEYVCKAIVHVPARSSGEAHQDDAATRDYTGVLVATDPPYYDNIGYSDLSDFFYVWLRRSLRRVHPQLFSTMLVPKAEELVANPYRHGGKKQAEDFFEEGFEHVFARARVTASHDFPITVFYAFKQAELKKDGITSTGWATFLEGLIRAGWTITATWPVRSELSNRMIASGTNALASSIVLALRPRSESAPPTDRAGFLAALHNELDLALPKIQQGLIAPADLRQTILGPGMAVFSRFSRVLEDDGTQLTVKQALTLINQTFDTLENEQDADLDPDTRFCLDWLRSYGWGTRPYGDAESLALPLGLSVEGIARGGVITSGAGKVALIKPLGLDPSWDPATDDRTSTWEVTCHLARAYATEGREAAARLLAAVTDTTIREDVPRLAARLYELLEKSDAATAGLFNGLGSAMTDITATARDVAPRGIQEGFNYSGE